MINLKPSNKIFIFTTTVIIVIMAGFLVMTRKDSSKQVIIPVASASAAEVHKECEAKPQSSQISDCYETAFKSDMQKNGAKSTLILLENLEKLGGYAQSNCHPLSHVVGNIALHVYGSVPAAAPEYLPVCHSGYYHGLLEEYLGTAESYEKGVTEVCGAPETSKYFNWFQCTHGLGHGVMQFRDNELPLALKDCDLVDVAHSGREICYAGAFMENITTDEKTGHPAKYIKKEDTMYPCNAVDIQYKSACYFLASSQIFKIKGWDIPKYINDCQQAEKDYRWLCYQSMGRDVAGSTLRNVEKVSELCAFAVEAFRSDCYFGAVRDFVNEKGEFDSGITLCNTIAEGFRQRCYDAIFLDLGLIKSGNDALAVCAKMSEPYQAQCRQRHVR